MSRVNDVTPAFAPMPNSPSTDAPRSAASISFRYPSFFSADASTTRPLRKARRVPATPPPTLLPRLVVQLLVLRQGPVGLLGERLRGEVREHPPDAPQEDLRDRLGRLPAVRPLPGGGGRPATGVLGGGGGEMGVDR